MSGQQLAGDSGYKLQTLILTGFFFFLFLLQGDAGPRGLPGPPGIAGPQVSEPSLTLSASFLLMSLVNPSLRKSNVQCEGIMVLKQ